MPKPPMLFPSLRYADARAAIDFLCRAFGFERHAVFTDDDDPSIVIHAELTFGDSMVMLSSALPNESQRRYGFKTPAQAGCITMSVSAVVENADEHYARAKAAGASIITEIHDNVGYPGRSYNAKDPEGNDWDFGTYNPWAV
jgi:uncharacterized glyoxalase superfamily protein PhnB